ncbi:NAD-binding protein [Natronosporangium hydrolyticum]|uniref:NAD-binding protein n=1 Tax=Natronosporangium hydrolyticum TaxID=2811111 RepID=A0A895YEG6_9ACTN|nr:NAD-binding protein [Natronosporangium hydrolyticum]QSB13823.1 NAD-binding protein [Natronosporangium hydrolyticum]
MTGTRFVVCGDDPLAHSLVDELTSRYGAQVTVILRSRRRNHGPQLAALPRVRIVEAERLDADAFRAAKLGRASGLALVQQDDAGNIHAALRAQELYPGLRLVVRMFNMSLGHSVRRLFRDCAVLSDASMAAPELVAEALGEVAPNFVRLPGRTLYVTRRADVRREDVVCGIAATGPDHPPELLPADDSQADLVLAVANRRHGPARAARTLDEDDGPPVPSPRRHRRNIRRRRRLLALPRALLSLVDSKLELATLALIVIFVGGVVTIGLLDGVTPWQALYTTVIIAADAGDPDLEQGLLRQLTQAAVALAGIAMVPIITATVVNAVVNARLAAAVGRLQSPLTDHLVVIGLGNVGTRVLRMLHDLGHEVVAIDASESARGLRAARELDLPVVIGDATEEETLRLAAVPHCRAVLALSSSDVVNLEAALLAQTMRPGLRVVLRLFDGDFAQRVERAFAMPRSASVSSLAAPAFAAALFEREVIATIPVRRRVLLIAEVPVAAGAALAGTRVAELARAGEVRVIALSHRHELRPRWTPADQTVIAPGDRLIVVTNRTGLSRVLARAGGPPAESSSGSGPPTEGSTADEGSGAGERLGQ